MVETIRKAILEAQQIEPQQQQYEVVREQVERFTVEQIDEQIANLQKRIDELKVKKVTAIALK